MSNNTSTLQKILNDCREVAHTQRDSGTLFEELMIKYFENEPKFAAEYKEVQTYADWVEQYGEELGILNKKDTGIDLVATNELGEHHAIQWVRQVSLIMLMTELSKLWKTLYSFELLLRVINVGLNAQTIVRNFPKLVLEKVEK